MKEDKNDIDQFFKDRLENREFDVPASFVDDLENRLDKNPKRPPFYLNFWFLAALLILVGGVSAIVYYSFPGQTDADTQTITQESDSTQPNDLTQNISSNNDDESDLTQNNDADNDSKTSDNNNTETSNDYTQDSENKNNTPQVNNSSKSTDRDHKNPVSSNESPTKKTKTPPQNVKKNIKTGEAKNDKTKGDQKNTNTTSSNDGSSDNKTSKDIDNDASKDNKTSKNNKGLENAESSEESSEAENNTSTPPSVEDTLKSYKDTIKIEKVVTRDSIIFKDSIIIRDSIVIKDSLVIRDSVVTKKKSDVSDWGYELQAYGGLGMVRKSIETVDSDYQNALENGETNMNTPSLGFNFNVNYKKWSLSTGLGYYQTGEDISFETESVNVYDSIFIDYYDEVITYDTDSSGQSFPVDTNYYAVYDTTTISDTLIESFNNQNLYTWLTIPVSFGYEFKFGKWAFVPRVGANFSFGLSQNNGIYPTINNEYQEIQAVKFGISYMVQLEIRKEFEYFHIYLSPFYRNRFQPSVTTPNMDRKYSIFGINGGIGVRF